MPTQEFSWQTKEEIALERFKLAKRPAQFGVATLMLLVAVSAVVVYSYTKISEKRAKLERARVRYAVTASGHGEWRKSFEKSFTRTTDPGKRAWLSEQARYYGDLEKKYTKAASVPWTAVEPDPPRPPLVPTDEQLAKWKVSTTREERYKDYQARKLRRIDRSNQPSIPTTLSDLLKSP